MKRIVLEDHNPQWAEQFLRLKEVYEVHLGGLIAGIEHVGSTSIPGIKAKPVIDIDIIVEKPERLRDVILQLEGLGYIHAGDLGIEGREAFSRTSSEVPVSHPRREWPPHHLYVCRQGIESLQNHLLLRDYLRNHPEKAREYSALKEELLKRVNDDIDLYVEGKSEFIATVLEKAGLPAASITRMRGQNKAPVPDGERIQIVRNQSA